MGMIRDASDLAGANGTSLGVSTTWTTAAAGTGNLQIILVHEPEALMILINLVLPQEEKKILI